MFPTSLIFSYILLYIKKTKQMETNNCLSFLSCSFPSTNNCSTLLQTLLVYVRLIGNQPVDVSRFSILFLLKKRHWNTSQCYVNGWNPSSGRVVQRCVFFLMFLQILTISAWSSKWKMSTMSHHISSTGHYPCRLSSSSTLHPIRPSSRSRLVIPIRITTFTTSSSATEVNSPTNSCLHFSTFIDFAFISFFFKAGGRFEVDERSGVVRTRGGEPFQLDMEYVLYVKAEDQNGRLDDRRYQSTPEERLSIVGGKRPPQFYMPSYEAEIPENQKKDTE